MKKETTPQICLELPYEAITETASRDKVIRPMAAAKIIAYGQQSYYIPFGIIHFRPLFNGRIKPSDMSEEEWEKELDIETLALNILANGLQDALKGDLNEDASIFWLTDGERRWRAIGWLLRHGHTEYTNGAKIDMVEVVLNKKGTTEEQRLLIMLSTDSKKKYNHIELGRMFIRLKQNFQYSHDKIKDTIGVSRQTVDNMVKLASEPMEIQEAILTGKIAPTAALELINKEKDTDKRIEIVTGKVASGTPLKVKDAANIAKYSEYIDLMAAVVEKYNEDLITYDKAVSDVREIAENAIQYLPATEHKEINQTWDNTNEVLDNNKANKEIEKEKDSDTPFDQKEPHMPELEKQFSDVLVNFNTGTLDFIGATKAIVNLGIEATKEEPDNEQDIEILEAKAMASLNTLNDIKKKNTVKKIDTKEAIDAEQESRTTSATYKEPSRPKEQADDALQAIDFTKDREQGEMELNEATKLLDKLTTKIDMFPDHLKQYKDDCNGLIVFIQGKLNNALEIIKKAGDKR